MADQGKPTAGLNYATPETNRLDPSRQAMKGEMSCLLLVVGIGAILGVAAIWVFFLLAILLSD